MEWSKYQTAIFNHVEGNKGDLVIQAVAGSGKTTVAKEIMRRAPGKCLYTAFNTDIVAGPKDDMPANVKCQGLNSFGAGIIHRACRQTRFNAEKIVDLYNKAFQHNPMMRRERDVVLKLVRFAKADLLTPSNDRDRWQALVDRYGIAGDSLEDADLIEAARVVLDLSNRTPGEVDFDDQLYLPALYDWAPPKFATVLVDEFQDMTLAQIRLVMYAARDGGRVIVVGDRAQSIYTWRGAYPEAIDIFKSKSGADELPLSISYRCAKSIVGEAKRLVPQIEPADDAPEGEVRTLDAFGPETFQPADLIVSRKNAPLVSLAYSLIADQVPIFFVRKNIGAKIMQTLNKLKANHREKMHDELNLWEEVEVNKYLRAGKDQAAENIQQRAETARVVLSITKATKKEDILAEVKEVFGQPKRDNSLVLSTVHRAKGQEADRVFILEPGDLEPQWVKGEMRQREERNVHYVALTRAKTSLSFIDLDGYCKRAAA